MRCAEIMQRDVAYLSLTNTAQEAACRMRDLNVGFLPVCNGAGHAIGTITDRDLAVRLVAEKGAHDTEVIRLMTGDVISCRVDDDVDEAQRLMAKHHKSRIIVVEDGGRVAGVISLSDIAEKIGGSLAVQTMQQVARREVRAP
jgi:CBS domain-containing protein